MDNTKMNDRAFISVDDKTNSRKRFQLLKEFIQEEDGIGVVEIILILVVLISLVLLFKDKITSLANTIFTKINTNANKV